MLWIRVEDNYFREITVQVAQVLHDDAIDRARGFAEELIGDKEAVGVELLDDGDCGLQ